MAEPETTMTAGDLERRLGDWLIAQALREPRIEALFDALCRRADAGGLSLMRGHMAVRAVHPLVESTTVTWWRDSGVEGAHMPHGRSQDTPWRQSPLRALAEQGLPEIRYRLDAAEDWRRFPVLVEFADAGATDYLALLAYFGDRETALATQDGVLTSWLSDRPGGFTDRDLATLRHLAAVFGLAAKAYKREQTALNVVSAYLGADAGQRVLEGRIRRGDGDTITAVIWFSDLRGSTAMADALPGDQYLARLNAFFEATAGAVLDHGGEVLKFIGDAVLGIFPIAGLDGTTRACRVALAAARDATARLAAAATDGPPMSFGLGLHVGEVLFGNIGVPARLDFSVVGPAVNEACRIEELTKQSGHPVLVSEAFARHLPIAWLSLGRRTLRGIGGERELLVPPPT